MPSGLPQSDRISVAVITGGHAFDVPGFHHLLGSLSQTTDCYVQALENFAADVGQVRDAYNVLLFYNMHLDVPPQESKVRTALDRLGTQEQGLFLLHHGLVAYKDWSYWSELVGIHDRHIRYEQDLSLSVNVADAHHPITRGLDPWQMVDEAYLMPEPQESHVLLTVDHPQSMHAIAWTRRFRQSRLFCFQSGHDHQTWANPNFRTVLSRGIQWCSGRI